MISPSVSGRRRSTTYATILAVAAIVLLASCSGSGAPPPPPEPVESPEPAVEEPEPVQEQEVRVGYQQSFYDYNADSLTGNSAENRAVAYLTRSNFTYYDAERDLVADTSFGTQEKVGDDPLEVTYTFAEGAQWSDGVPVDAADLVLYWGAKSGSFATVEPDEETGRVDEVDAEAGVYFNAPSAPVGLIEEFPEISADHSAVTFTYAQPYADWETNLHVGVPAHVVAMRALNISDPIEAKQFLIDAFREENTDALAAISTFWNEGFTFDSALPKDPALYLSSGPYTITDLHGDHLTLEKNPDYTGERRTQIDRITLQYIDDSADLVDALEAGEVDLISPHATAETIERLTDLGEEFRIITGEEDSYEHVELMINNGGPFDPQTYDGDEAAALQVRQAFLKLLPRQQIVEELISPLGGGTQIRNSFFVAPGSPMYEQVSEGSGMKQYDVVDPQGAAELIEAAGVETPIKVRLAYDIPNERRAEEFDLIADSAAQEGLFEVVNSPVGHRPSGPPETTDFDALLFDWQSTSSTLGAAESRFRTNGENNLGGFSDPEVDALFDELALLTDPDEQIGTLTQIEQRLVNDAVGVTLWQFPSVTAHVRSLHGVEPIPLSPTIFHRFWDWSVDPPEIE